MDYTILGRTGLRVSVLGLGGGGHSRLGQSYGLDRAESVRIVRQAFDAGITFFDTAESYGTEELFGEALRDVGRDRVVLSTKKSMAPDTTPEAIRAGCEASLRRLGTDYVDVYHLHGVAPDQYEKCRDLALPVLRALQSEGKVRFVGITERFGADFGHRTLAQALEDDLWDVMMVGFNLLNPSARERVLPEAQRRNVGIFVMFAVRRALSHPERLREVVQELVARGEVDRDAIDLHDPLGFLVCADGSHSITEAAYRFCRHEPGVHVTLTGTGKSAHLSQNVTSILRPPLPAQDLRRLQDLFGRVESVSGN